MGHIVYGKPMETNSKVLNDISTKRAIDSIKKNIDTLWVDFDKMDNFKTPERVRREFNVKK